MQHVLGGKVEKAEVSEYGKTEVLIDKKDSKLFENVSVKNNLLDEPYRLHLTGSSRI